jgi:hypothetical protein
MITHEAMLKTPEKRTVATEKVSVSYQEGDQPTLGIAFCKKDGTQRFAPYSFLTAVDFHGKGELVFCFTHWSAIVRGEELRPLWEAVQEGRLALVRELDKSPAGAEPWVHELIFAESDSERSLFTLPFPQGTPADSPA